VLCPQCSAANDEGRKFCGECGSPLTLACAQCGSANTPGVKFCGECGSSLDTDAPAVAPVSAGREAPASERRLVSVLFADLVGFTTLSESRDSEEVRDLLSRYFDACRLLIERYGGTVEKFIGDAVMAVWGTPVAQEDDAERAVRTALDLVAAVPELDPALQARAGVLTGEAAVTIGAERQGMVAGDLVNTASRVQSAAEPGTVLVGESTKRTTEAAILYEDAGLHELKGKAEPVTLFHALRVLGARGGARKSEGLEPPFVGRDRELRLVKELFHASAEEGKAHLVSAMGIAGIGKSRLAWEFDKYTDGLVGTIYWHRGRCLAYGEGVAYWALAEMVRMRARIIEGEVLASSLAKLREAIELHVPDPEERAWIEPRLAHLLGLDERSTHERDDLFAAWRLFFERMAEQEPVCLVFEDMHWADVSLLDFVEYLLEWSRNHPIFVLALSRPELAEHHPSFGQASRNATTLSLEPLSPQAMEALLDGFVPGLPEELRTQILERAEGVPLYAVETVRMLLDRSLLEREGEVYRPTGPIEALDVPETLHALIAARLDGLSAEERRLIQDASVLGKTFTKPALSDLAGLAEAELEPLLSSLVRKEVLGLQADPRSPERGQYGFLQDLLKRVAYETLSRKERKTLHLAAAEYLERAWGTAEHEIVEVVASHYLAAYEAAPEADDATEIKAKAQTMLGRAAERAASLGASDEASRYFAQAAELVDDPLVEAALREQAGQKAWMAGERIQAEEQYQRALALFEAQGATHPAARVSAKLGEAEWQTGRLAQALERLESAFAVLAADKPDADVAALAAQLGRLHFFQGDLEQASERIESALSLAESLWLPEVISHSLITAGLIAGGRRRPEQAIALIKHALELALEHDLFLAALRACNNLGDQLDRRDRYEEALVQHERGLELARRVGSRFHEWRSLAEMGWCLYMSGRWSEARATLDELPEQALNPTTMISAHLTLVGIDVHSGRIAEAKRVVEQRPRRDDSADVQERAASMALTATLLHAEGRYEDAFRVARQAVEIGDPMGLGADAKLALVVEIDSAFGLDRLDDAEETVSRIEALPTGDQPAFLRAHAARFRARLAAARGEHDAVEQGFKTAEQIFREYGIPFWLAVTQLEHGEWLTAQGRSEEAEPLLAEAGETFERLEAAPWLERAGRLGVEVPA
jgi:class 3 adenylate cyclase/tetratricopeptide (TPR) repeat protein